MTVLSVVQDATLEIGVERPESVFGSNASRELRELQSLVNECARMIAFDSNHDWSRLKTVGTLTGDGTALSFNLPPDYKRMLKKARLWSSATPYSPFTHYPDTDAWLGTQVQSFSPVVGAWTIIGNQVHIRVGGNTAALQTDATVQFYYLTSKIVLDKNAGAKASFTADEDVFLLDERLLKLALVYRWKQGKNQDYAEAMSDFGNALQTLISGDKGSNILSIGRARMSVDAVYAFPGTIGRP